MSKFGEDLRKERLSRGIALEDISTVTKISQRHLVALEQEHFRQLPGGILNKGIVRGYVGALGMDESDWTERFLTAYRAAGLSADDEDRGWTAFASNVGKARMVHRDAIELRIRWIGAMVLMAVVITAAIFAIRTYGLRAGWWQNFTPLQSLESAFSSHLHAMISALKKHL